MANSRTKWKCLDCKVDTGYIGEHYFVHTDLWLKVVGSINGMLCVGCLEKRLGRKLTPADFPNVHINRPSMCGMSQRLMERIQGVSVSN